MTDTLASRTVHVLTFGYEHGAPPPEADLTLDLRRTLHNPACDPAMRYMTGLDQVVYEHVMATPGAQHLAHNTVLAVYGLLSQTDVPSLTVAVGCAGGRHRAVVMGREVARLLSGYEVELRHRDVHRDVLPPSRPVEDEEQRGGGCAVRPCRDRQPEALVRPGAGRAPLPACEWHAAWLLAAVPGAVVEVNPAVPTGRSLVPLDLDLVQELATSMVREHEERHDGNDACPLCDPGCVPVEARPVPTGPTG